MDFAKNVNNILVYARDLNFVREQAMTLHFFKPAGMNQYLPINPALNSQKLSPADAQDTPGEEQQKKVQSPVPEDYQKILEMQTSLDFWKNQHGLDFIL